MKTTMIQRSVAVVMGVVALAGVTGEASAKGGLSSFFGVPKVKDIIRIKRPKIKFLKQNDLAATKLVAKTDGDAATAKVMLVGTCRNLGSKVYQSSQRLVRIEKKVGEEWTPLGEKAVPMLLPGQTFTVSLKLTAEDAGEFRLVITPGAAADEDTDNDVFIPQSGDGEGQAEPAPLDPPQAPAAQPQAPAAAPQAPPAQPEAPAEPAK